VFVVGGSVLSNAKAITEDTQSFVISLGQTVPSQANFYVTFTLVAVRAPGGVT